MGNIRAPHLPAMSTEFFDRRDRLHMTQDELAKEAGVNRDTVGSVESGQGSLGSRRKIDDALTRLEHDAGLPPIGAAVPMPATSEAPHLIEFEVTGDFGVRVVVKGPVENAAELEASVVRLIRDMKANPPTQG
jgi:DNA-binding XRE family transcriptional regulator